MRITRREFLQQSGQSCLGYALGAAAFTAGIERFGLIFPNIGRFANADLGFML